MRRTFADIKLSRIPHALQLCSSDTPQLLSYTNEAQERLIQAGGEPGWWGSWYKTVFNVDPDDPYITMPREIARLSGLNVCNTPIRINNEFFEFLEAGYGLQPQVSCSTLECCSTTEGYQRGRVYTQRDLTATGNTLRVYRTDVRDVGKRVLIAAKDANGNRIFTTHATVGEMEGIEFVFNDAVNYVDSAMEPSLIYGVQKDLTYGRVLLYQKDSTTGAEVLLGEYAPSEKAAEYQRYYLGGLPSNCVDGATTVQVTAMAKLEFIPVAVDTDYLLIGNIPALKEECFAIKYAELDSPAALALSMQHHRAALKLLRNELEHYVGKDQLAVNFAPFGTATLECQQIGNLV